MICYTMTFYDIVVSCYVGVLSAILCVCSSSAHRTEAQANLDGARRRRPGTPPSVTLGGE